MKTIEESIEIDVPVATAYNQWTQFESFPRFMDGVERVEQTGDTRLHWVAEVEDERVPRFERVSEKLAHGHLVFDVVRAAPARRRQRADDLPVGCRTAIHVHDRQKIVSVLVDVPGPGKHMGAPTGFPGRRQRRTARHRQEEQADSMAVRCPNAIGSGVERTGGRGDRFGPHKAESSGTPKTIRRSVTARR